MGRSERAKSVKFRKPFERLTNIHEAKLIEVIEIKSLVGEGDEDGSPIREIREYYSKEGELLARYDHLLDDLGFGVWEGQD